MIFFFAEVLILTLQVCFVYTYSWHISLEAVWWNNLFFCFTNANRAAGRSCSFSLHDVCSCTNDGRKAGVLQDVCGPSQHPACTTTSH